MNEVVKHFSNGMFELEVTPHPVDGFHVQAPGLAKALSVYDAKTLLRSIPDSEKGAALVPTLGGQQETGYVTEAGFYRALGMRQTGRIQDEMARARVEAFQNWVYREVLPSIRTTGGYQVEAPRIDINAIDPRTLALAILEESDRADAAEAKIAELEPAAMVADKLLNADGDLSVADAAKALTRGGVQVGGGRLFTLLETMKWVYRDKGDNRWRVYQRPIESGHMSVLPQSHYHPKTGVLVLDPPQPRVTPKGIQRLLSDHGASHVDVSALLNVAVSA